MPSRIPGPLWVMVPLVLPCLGGLLYLYAFGAPARLLVINGAALAAALAWIALGRMPASRGAGEALAIAAMLGLLAPLVLGPEVSGVPRWLPAGPVMLHSGALLLPLLTVLAARARKIGPALLGAAGAALALQPDAAMLAGLAAASTVLALWHRHAGFALALAASAQVQKRRTDHHDRFDKPG